jgi:hypothetical protein
MISDRDYKILLLAIGLVFMLIIGLTFTTRQPFVLVTLGSNGQQNYQFPTLLDCEKAKDHVDRNLNFVLTKCVEQEK